VKVLHRRIYYSIVLFAVGVLISVPVATGQSLYLTPGENAISLSTFFSTNQRMSGLHGVSSFSINGLIDLGIGVGHSSISEKVLDYDVSAYNIQPYLLFCVYKSNGEDFPVSLALGLSHDHYDYLNPVLDVQKPISFVGNFYSFDVLGYGNVYLSETSYLQPMVSFGYLNGNSEMVNKVGKVFSTQYYSTVIGTAVDFVLHPGDDFLYHIRPSMTFSRETPTFALTAGIVIISVE
jgi:hypothetical protein